MNKTVTLELPEDVYETVSKAAEAAGKTPADWIAANVGQRVRARDERLRSLFGAVSLGHPTGIDNERIDADLAKEYGSTHEDESP